MTEWWTYRPSDFLMFSPRVYWRLFESINLAWWPAQVALVGLPLGWLWRGQRRLGSTAHIAPPALFLAGSWAIVAWAFLHERFAPINWIADAYAVAFGVAAAGFAALAAMRTVRADRGRARASFALMLVLLALVVHPLLAMLAGRPWQQAEVFGLAPDPTAIGTLGFLLLLRADAAAARLCAALLWSIAVAWCLVSAATLATMQNLQAAVPLSAAVLALIAARTKD